MSRFVLLFRTVCCVSDMKSRPCESHQIADPNLKLLLAFAAGLRLGCEKDSVWSSSLPFVAMSL